MKEETTIVHIGEFDGDIYFCRYRINLGTGYTGYINFHQNSKVYKTLFSYENRSSKTNFDPYYLYSPLKSSLIWDSYNNTMLVCETSPPTEGKWDAKNRITVTLGYTLRISLEITLGFKLPVGDVNGPS